MSRTISIPLSLLLLICLSVVAAFAINLPDPKVDLPRGQSGQQSVVLGGGCFWGVQVVFEHVEGVTSVQAGYSGGAANTANYEAVSTGDTGHAESVKITYDPAQVSYGQLLKVFFSVAHDPTELNRQGPDSGTQYRSVIFFDSPDQKRVAENYIAQLDEAKVFPKKIFTQVVPLKQFYPAEKYHQDYAVKNPHSPYIVTYDLPKVANLRKELPALYVGR